MDPTYCKVITPMFLAGGQEKVENNRVQKVPEFRAPSIRGALRWWFRAVAGGYVNLSELKRLEGCLFGDPDKAGASSLVVRVWAAAFDKEAMAFMLPHKQGNQRANTRCIPVGTCFKVTLQESAYDPAPDALKTAKTLFNLSATLGGLGRRSRRGFGAFQPTDWKFENTGAVKEHVEAKVEAARKVVKAFIDAHPPATVPTFAANAVADYPILHPNVANIRVGEARGWDSFIKALMTATHDFLKPPQFCLNITDKKKQEQCIKAERKKAERVLGSGVPRQASTLIVSVVEVKGGQIVPIYTQFYCKTQNRFRNRTDFDEIKDLPAKVSSSLLSVAIP